MQYPNITRFAKKTLSMFPKAPYLKTTTNNKSKPIVRDEYITES